MNKENLIKMANHILTVDPKYFDMGLFREGGNITHECNTSGCIIGHCVILDAWENVPLYSTRYIAFRQWSEDFTGLNSLDDTWEYLFKDRWKDYDDTLQKASKRLMAVANGFEPTSDDLPWY